MKLLITGVAGFVGSNLVKCLSNDHRIIGQVRVPPREELNLFSCVEKKIDSNTNWNDCLSEVDVVVHLAAVAHTEPKDIERIREVNVDGTLNLARQAVSNGVKRFVFVSSIGVLGSHSTRPLDEKSPTLPHSPYTATKLLAEESLLGLVKNTGMELVIIRPPLVYGVDAPGNFSKLVSLVERSALLPFGLCENKRSFIAVDNLIDFISICLTHPKAAGEVFCISDGKDVSTKNLTNQIAEGLNRKVLQLPVPVFFLRLLFRLIGKSTQFEQLFSDLQINSAKANQLLGWTPVVSMKNVLCKLPSIHGRNPKSNRVGIRVLDLAFALTGLLLAFPILLVVLVVGSFDTGSPVFVQERMGRRKKPFMLIKFRTMKIDTESVASHLASTASITKFGAFLRRTKVDELPQLINVLKGEMSIVGPRPNLFNQEELIAERDACGVYDVLPGITGLAQLNDIDMSTPSLLAETDQRMMESLNIRSYLKYVLMTAMGKGAGDRVKF